MKTRIAFSLLLVSILAGLGCQKEKPLEKVDHIDFLRFYHVADEAVEMVKSDGGYTILANGTKSDGFGYFQLIKVGDGGGIVWQREVKSDTTYLTGTDLIHIRGGGYAVSAYKSNPFGYGYSQLYRFGADGSEIWVGENPQLDSIPDPRYTTSTIAVTRKSEGKAVVEMEGGNLILFSFEEHPDSGNSFLLEQYDQNGEFLAPGISWSDEMGLTAGDMVLNGDVLTVFGESEFTDFNLGSSDMIAAQLDVSQWDSDTDLKESYQLFWYGSDTDPDHLDLSGRVTQCPQGLAFIGTSISPSNGIPHMHVILTDGKLEELVWEYFEEGGETRGICLASMADGGIVAVGEKIEQGNRNLFVVEFGPNYRSMEIDEITDPDDSTVVFFSDTTFFGARQRSFTFGSDLDPESAKAVLVTPEGKWLILGDNSFQGQSGIWLMQIDPEKLD